MGSAATVRVGVIGRGIGAHVVAPVFEETDGCTVVDVVSPRDDDAVTALCARDDVDLISVHSPPFLHLDHVRRAIERGHAVLCDKPFGVNALEAEEMHDLARRRGDVEPRQLRVPLSPGTEQAPRPGARRRRRNRGARAVERRSRASGVTRRVRSVGCSTRRSAAVGCERTQATASTSSVGRSVRSWTPRPASGPRSRNGSTPKGACTSALLKTD